MILFDLDGTLIDSADAWLDIDLDFLARRGLVHTEEYHNFVAHASLPSAAEYTKKYYNLNETPEAIIQEWKDMLRFYYENTICLKPYVTQYLEKCRNRNKTCVIVTSSTRELCEAVLKRCKIFDFFSDFIYAEEIGIEKRRSELFTAAAKKLGVKVDECMLFDDSPVVCAAAKAAGVKVTGVFDKHFASYEEQMRRDCDSYITSFKEIL